MKHIKLVQLDGKLPNLALMKLAHWHHNQGDEVILSRSAQRTLFEQEDLDLIYASAIFSHSATPLPGWKNSGECTRRPLPAGPAPAGTSP